MHIRAAVLAIVATAFHASAQSPRAFEVASIRRNLSGSMNTQINISGGRLTVINGSLKTLIRNAWDLQSFQFAGGPAWLDTDMYDIVATTGRDTPISPDEFRLLLRSLVEDRFHLVTHFETRQTSIYALVIAKGGPKLKPDTTHAEPGINTSKNVGAGHMKGTNEPISILAANLGNQLGRIVEDRTGLAGGYDWVLDWDPDPSADSKLPSLFTAAEHQLGLRLEPARGPMDVLVIDRAEKPTEN